MKKQILFQTGVWIPFFALLACKPWIAFGYMVMVLVGAISYNIISAH